jgi:hypothetical protein
MHVHNHSQIENNSKQDFQDQDELIEANNDPSHIPC